ILRQPVRRRLIRIVRCLRQQLVATYRLSCRTLAAPPEFLNVDLPRLHASLHSVCQATGAIPSPRPAGDRCLHGAVRPIMRETPTVCSGRRSPPIRPPPLSRRTPMPRRLPRSASALPVLLVL